MTPGEKLRLREVVIVEGKYDKIRLDTILDALIIPLGGFSVFSDSELRDFLRRLARERGLIILTDSDGAGFKIRGYLSGIIPSEQLHHVYIPDVFGKEKRKRIPSKEGKLGVEGMDLQTLRHAFEKAGVVGRPAKNTHDEITRLDLYEDGLTGGENSSAMRQGLYQVLGLPARLNTTALLRMLNAMLTRQEYIALIEELKG